jgi:hypothetical protein
MKLDLSNLRKIDSDKNCTVLEHPNGHQLKVAHKGLKPEFRKQLEDLPIHKAMGGKLKGPFTAAESQEHERMSKPSEVSKPQSGAAYKQPKEAAHNYTEPDEGGTDIVLKALHREAPPFGPVGMSKPAYPPCINPSCKSYGKSHPNCRCYGGKTGQTHEEMFFADGGKVNGSYCSEDRAHQKGCEYFKAGGMSGEESEAEAAPSETPSPSETPAPSGQPVAAPTPYDEEIASQISASPRSINVEPTPINTGTPTVVGGEPAANNASEAPEEDSAAPEPEDQSQPQQKAEDTAPVMNFQQHKDNISNELNTESQSFNNDLNNGHIKPETYQDLFANKSTLGKIGTLFGLMVGGAGAGLSHQPNMLMEMMNKQIDNDLKGQEASATNRQNFLRINQQNILNQAQAQNMNVETATKAYALARTQMNYAALHKLTSDLQRLPPGSPQRAQAEQTLAMLSQGVQNENFNILDRASAASAFYKTILGNQSGNGSNTESQFQNKIKGMKMLGPEGQKQGEDQESKHYPGIPGQASAPLTQDDRTQIHSGLGFERSLDNFTQWAKSHSGDLNPKDIKYGKALAADLQGAYRQATHGGVYKEGEQNFISSIVDSDPTKFFNSVRVVPQLDAIGQSNKLRLDQLLKDKGFQGYPGLKGSSDQQTKTVKGVKYMRGSNGKAVKVK